MKHKGKDTREADHLIPAPGPDPIATAEVPVVEAGDVRIGRPRTMNALAALVFLCLSAEHAAAQSHGPSATTDSATVAPGLQYRKSGFWTVFAGRHYRSLWVTPIRVPVLDIEHFAGGLRPLRAHTGSQTKSLRLAGADGREYQFRSVDKDPTATLAPELRGTAYGRALRDGVSASFPAAPLVANGLLESAGVLVQPQFLAMMPDHPALGEFRSDFKGVLGLIEERTDARDEKESVAGAVRRVISPAALFRRVDASPTDRVDARAFLRARLMDIVMGDRDRHRDQFRWAESGQGHPSVWLPISRDHDEAFVQLDGLALRISALYYPPLVTFGPTYPKDYRLNWHAREVDRRFLVRWSARHGTRSRRSFTAGSPTQPSTRPHDGCHPSCTRSGGAPHARAARPARRPRARGAPVLRLSRARGRDPGHRCGRGGGDHPD